MTDNELCNLMMGGRYIKETIPGVVHLSSFSGIDIDNSAFIRAGNNLVERGYFQQVQPIPELIEDLDSVLSTFALTPSGVENIENLLKEKGPHKPFGKVDTATIVIQVPWFGGKATFQDNSNTESTNIEIMLKTALGNIIEQIEGSGASPADKAEAKSKLKAFLLHPLVSAIAGAAVETLLKSL